LATFAVQYKIMTENTIIRIKELFNNYHALLCNVANNMVNDRAAAEDIVQDVFMNLWRKRNEVDWTAPMKGYVYRATTNGALNWLDKNKRSVSFDETIGEQTASVSNDVEGKIDEKELQAKIKESIERLPAKCKAIFVLNRYEGLKYKQIAEHLEISVKTVENQISIALDRLRQDLGA